jgi:hypothetical protein
MNLQWAAAGQKPYMNSLRYWYETGQIVLTLI